MVFEKKIISLGRIHKCNEIWSPANRRPYTARLLRLQFRLLSSIRLDTVLETLIRTLMDSGVAAISSRSSGTRTTADVPYKYTSPAHQHQPHLHSKSESHQNRNTKPEIRKQSGGGRCRNGDSHRHFYWYPILFLGRRVVHSFTEGWRTWARLWPKRSQTLFNIQ